MGKLGNILFRWLRRWGGRTPSSLRHVRMVMYTRAGCHLCEAAWERLRREQQRWHFQLEAVDVDTDTALAARHGDEVPVVTINGKIRFRGGLNGVLLSRLLEAEARAAGRKSV